MTGPDAPIFQQASYFPIAFRTAAFWHRDSSNRVAVDNVPGHPAAGQTEAQVNRAGFNITGVDILTLGTLAKNAPFGLHTAIANQGSPHFRSNFSRLDNCITHPG